MATKAMGSNRTLERMLEALQARRMGSADSNRSLKVAESTSRSLPLIWYVPLILMGSAVHLPLEDGIVNKVEHQGVATVILVLKDPSNVLGHLSCRII